MKCKKYETAGTYGSGDIIMDNSLYSIFQLYFESFRPIYDVHSCEKFIITKTGTPFNASQVSSSAQSCWRKNRLDSGRAMTANVFRKSAATAVYLHDTSQSDAAAAIMLHTARTHGRNYMAFF